MAGSLNRAMLIGHLGRDPETRTMPDGNKVVNLSIATSESWKDRQSGERREKTEWHRVVIFNQHLAGIAETWLRKGSQVFIEGKIQTRKWSDQSGVERYSTEIVLTNFNGTITMLSGQNDNQRPDTGGSGPGGDSAANNAQGADGLDDEIPF
jgi:single-strand DNA-binding protein